MGRGESCLSLPLLNKCRSLSAPKLKLRARCGRRSTIPLRGFSLRNSLRSLALCITNGRQGRRISIVGLFHDKSRALGGKPLTRVLLHRRRHQLRGRGVGSRRRHRPAQNRACPRAPAGSLQPLPATGIPAGPRLLSALRDDPLGLLRRHSRPLRIKGEHVPLHKTSHAGIRGEWHARSNLRPRGALSRVGALYSGNSSPVKSPKSKLSIC